MTGDTGSGVRVRCGRVDQPQLLKLQTLYIQTPNAKHSRTGEVSRCHSSPATSTGCWSKGDRVETGGRPSICTQASGSNKERNGYSTNFLNANQAACWRCVPLRSARSQLAVVNLLVCSLGLYRRQREGGRARVHRCYRTSRPGDGQQHRDPISSHQSTCLFLELLIKIGRRAKASVKHKPPQSLVLVHLNPSVVKELLQSLEILVGVGAGRQRDRVHPCATSPVLHALFLFGGRARKGRMAEKT